MGSDVGVIEKGTTCEVSLAMLQNHGGLPSLYMASSSDSQVQLDKCIFYLRSGEKAELMATISGENEGSFQANVNLFMFLPFLPQSIIEELARANIWLALSLISLIPALPLFVLPFLETRFRRRFIQSWHKRWNVILCLVR
jgi:hypothetical protein